MSHEVYADGNEIAGKAGMNKVIASFPDVCLSPPSPPAGPLPVPYPNSSFSKDLKEGSISVKLGGDPAALAQQSYYKTSPLGDEAATRALGMNVINHTITGKTYFQAWSMDVQIEGKNACRHVDITTSNHMSGPGGNPTPNPGVEAATMARIQAGECPCCGATLHDNQQNGDPKTEAEWYGTDDASMKKLEDEANAALENLNKMKAAQKTAPLSAAKAVAAQVDKLSDIHEATNKAYYQRLEVKDTIDEMRKMGCRNVPPTPDQDCGTYFAIHTHPEAINTTTGAPIPGVRMNFAWPWDAYGKARYEDWYNKANPTRPLPADHQIHHATPVSGGGCPLGGNPANGYANVVATQDVVDPKCNDLDGKVLVPAQSDAKKRWLKP